MAMIKDPIFIAFVILLVAQCGLSCFAKGKDKDGETYNPGSVVGGSAPGKAVDHGKISVGGRSSRKIDPSSQAWKESLDNGN